MPNVGAPVRSRVERREVESIWETELQLVTGLRQINRFPQFQYWIDADVRGLDREFQNFAARGAGRDRRQGRPEGAFPQFQQLFVALPDREARDLSRRRVIRTRDGEERLRPLAGAL